MQERTRSLRDLVERASKPSASRSRQKIHSIPLKPFRPKRLNLPQSARRRFQLIRELHSKWPKLQTSPKMHPWNISIPPRSKSSRNGPICFPLHKLPPLRNPVASDHLDSNKEFPSLPNHVLNSCLEEVSRPQNALAESYSKVPKLENSVLGDISPATTKDENLLFESKTPSAYGKSAKGVRVRTSDESPLDRVSRGTYPISCEYSSEHEIADGSFKPASVRCAPRDMHFRPACAFHSFMSTDTNDNEIHKSSSNNLLHANIPMWLRSASHLQRSAKLPKDSEDMPSTASTECDKKAPNEDKADGPSNPSPTHFSLEENVLLDSFSKDFRKDLQRRYLNDNLGSKVSEHPTDKDLDALTYFPANPSTFQSRMRRELFELSNEDSFVGRHSNWTARRVRVPVRLNYVKREEFNDLRELIMNKKTRSKSFGK